MVKGESLLSGSRFLVGLLFVVLILSSLIIFMSSIVFAQEASSPSYKVDELFIGTGGSNDSASPSYQGRASIGDLGVGNSASTNFQAYASFTTTGDPVLEVVVSSATLDLGTLSDSTTASGTATFSVRTYLASGYIVITRGATPTSEGGATITPLSAGGVTTVGVEQFGMNLKDNTAPNIGAEAAQIPDSSFSYGYAAPGYDTIDNFRYNSGDTIAQSDSSSGETDYTISYIVNISPITDAGLYIFHQDLVVVGTY